MILANPGIVEEGFFPLDTQLRAGNGGLIDLLAVDGSGTLAVLDIARDGEENLLRRSLEHQGWIVGQLHFLRRLYGPERIHPFRAPRAVLLASRFSRGFLDRIAELPVAVTALICRLAAREQGPVLELRPATPPEEAPADPGAASYPEILSAQAAEASPLQRELDAGLAMATELAGETARLTPEEMEAFYRFERRRLGLKEEGALER